jgi:UPF0716 protein FxsA
MRKLVLLLIALPVAELFVLVRLSDAIGGWRVLLLVIASGLIGAQIARIAGFQVIAQSQKAFATGTLPSESVLNGALLFVASVLLITPGLITDVLAIALLIPWSRRLIGKRVVSGIERAIAQGTLRVQANQVDPWAPRPRVRRDPKMVIDTEGETVESSVTPRDDVPPPRLGS